MLKCHGEYDMLHHIEEEIAHTYWVTPIGMNMV